MVASTHEQFNIHPEWLKLFPEEFAAAFAIVDSLQNYQPDRERVFKVFESDPANIKVVVVGQDPYPTAGDAMGLAFSVSRSEKLPKSLQNLFKELHSDLGVNRNDGDLSDWQAQGVFLINRVLTVPIGVANGHKNLGWEKFTEKIIGYLGERGAVGLLMGKSAEEMAKYFDKKVVTAHPSPLSAYRGFFGSKPFSGVNALLDIPIKW
jgi:uracil-DNA glycosylase